MIAPRFQQRIAALCLTGADILAIAGVESLRGGEDHVKVCCPSHGDRHPSLSVNLTTGRARCFVCGAKAGDAVALLRLLKGLATMGEALRDLEARRGKPVPQLHLKPAVQTNGGGGARPSGTLVEVFAWMYHHADGTGAFRVRRMQFRQPDGSWAVKTKTGKPEKIFLPAAPTGTANGMPPGFDRPGSRPLYRLPQILAAPISTDVWINEGEKAADALVARGVVATTSSGGAACPRNTNWSPLAGRRVRIWPDNDEAGARYAEGVASILRALSPAPTIRFVDIVALGMGPGEDAADWAARQPKECNL